MLTIYISNSFALLNSLVSPPQPVGLRNWNAAPFASFEKISAAADYSNTDCVGSRVGKGIPAQASHRTVREALASYGSYHITKHV